MDIQLPLLAKRKLDNEANRGVPRLLRLLGHVSLLETLDTQAPQYEQPPNYDQTELEDLADLLKAHIEKKSVDNLGDDYELFSMLRSADVIEGVEELPAYEPPTMEVVVEEVEVEDDD